MVLFVCLLAGSGGQRVLGQAQQEQQSLGFHFAVVCTNGTIQTWGNNWNGQLGYATPTENPFPTTVAGLTDVAEVSVGQFHTIAVRCDGTVWTWGWNSDGQLGNGLLNGGSSVPTQVPNISNAISVSAGYMHSVVLLANGTVWTWGGNTSGQLGNGTNNTSTIPTQVSGITNAIAIKGYHMGNVALLQNGTLRAWGASTAQLDGGPVGDSNIPIAVNGLVNVVQIEAGGSNVLARIDNGTVWGWGAALINSTMPVQIAGLANVVDIAVGVVAGTALLSNGTLQVWGDNSSGTFGICSPLSSSVPINGPVIPNITHIDASNFSTIAYLSDGTIRTWGENTSGELGIGTINAFECTPQTPINVCAASTPGSQTIACCLNSTTFNQPLNNTVVFNTNYIPLVPNFGNFDARAGFVVGNFPAVATTINWNAAINPFGTADIWLNNDLVIPNNVTLSLNNLNIHFAPHARILVLQGGRLRLGNSTTNPVQLTGLCNAMWQGIQVVGPGILGIVSTERDIALRNFGVVDADNVQIKNALMGIAAQYMYLMDVNNINTTLLSTLQLNPTEYTPFVPINWFYVGQADKKLTGGVVRTNNGAHFTDCFEGINLSFYDNTAIAANTNTNNKCSIQNSHFDSPLGLPYPFNTAPYTQLHSESGVSLNVYANIEVGNNDASTPVNTFNTLKYGIRGNLAYNLTIRRNNISASDAGISLHNSNTPISGLPAFGTANIRHNTLNNNRVGIQAFGANLEIIHNTIDGNFTTPTQPRIGLFIGGSQFAVSNNNNLPNGNTIINQLIGAFITSNETGINHLRNNSFQNCFLPIWAFGANGIANDTDPTGVNITCNEFDQYAVALQVQQATNPIYGTTNRINDQGNCYPGNSQPADNTFFQTSIFDGVLPDISSQLPASASFTYFHRGGTAYTPQVSGAVIPFPCSGGDNTCQYPLLANASIQQIIDTDPKNRAAIDKMYFYLHDENDSIRNIAAVVQVLESINTDAAKRLLLSYDLEQGNYAALAQRLSQLPESTLNQQYAKQLTTLSSQLKQSNRSIFELNTTEKALLHTIANSDTQTAFDAQAILFVTQGEEYPLALPNLPDFFSPLMVQSFANFMVSFKTDANSDTKLSNIYPNPGKGTFYMDYAIANEKNAVLSIYNLNGQVVKTYTVAGHGTLSIDASNLQAGLYYYNMQQDGQSLSRNKIIVTR